MTRCPHCGELLQPNGTEDSLRAACAALGIVVAWDGTIDEAGAAALLNRSPLTLRNRRLSDRPLEFTRSGNRVRYLLATIAAFIDAGKNFDD